MEDRLSLYECIRDKISDYFMKQSYGASTDLMNIFGTILGEKMLWNLLIKGLFHHLHYIPKLDLNNINDQLSSRIHELQHEQIKQREKELELQIEYAKSLQAQNKKQNKPKINIINIQSSSGNDCNDCDDDNNNNNNTKRSKSKSKSQSKSKSKSNSKSKTKSKSKPKSKRSDKNLAKYNNKYKPKVIGYQHDFSLYRYINNLSDDLWINIFKYLNLYSILCCERVCHYFYSITSNNPACFTNFKYSFCPPNRSYMFQHYQRLNGINDPFYRFRHSTRIHLSFWSKENYEFRLLTAFGDRFRNVRSLTIEVNRESPLVDLSQLVKKYSNFFVSIRSVVICVHGLGQPNPNPHNRMITLYKSLISFILIRCSFIRTLTLNYSLLTQCYRHVSSCLELTQILCINSKSQLFNDTNAIEQDDYTNIIIFKMNNSNNNISATDLNDVNTNGHHHHRSHSHHHHHRHHRHHHRHHRRAHTTATGTGTDPTTDDNKDKDAIDNNSMKIIKLGNIETQIQREIKIIFYRRHVRYSFLSYFHNHIRSIHVHNPMGFSNDIDSPESRRLNLRNDFAEYENLREICLYNISSKITVFINNHFKYSPMLNKMNIIFDNNKNIYNNDQLYKTLKILLFNNLSSINKLNAHNNKGLVLSDISNDNSLDNNQIQQPTNATVTTSTSAVASGNIDDYGLDYEEPIPSTATGDNQDDQKGTFTDSTNSSLNGNINVGLYGKSSAGLVPKLMRKYLSIISLNCDISSNVKLLTNLEKSFEFISADLGLNDVYNNDNNISGFGTGSNDNHKSLLLSSLNLFVHIHIDVECNTTDEIKKLLQILKSKYFQCEYASYHIIAKKLKIKNNNSTNKNNKIKSDNNYNVNKTKSRSPKSIIKSNRFSLTNKFTFNNSSNNHKNDPNKSPPSSPITDDIKQQVDPSTLISPSILQRNTLCGANGHEIDDGNKSDGGNTQSNSNTLNFKNVFDKAKLFKNNIQKLIKSNSEPNNVSYNASSTNNNPLNNHNPLNLNTYTNNSKNINQILNLNDPNDSKNNKYQTLRFMKKATIHCDDINWICDCKYAKCSRKFRTFYDKK